ncbi:MAG TPA: ABC transporter ATP-binding protein [Thermoprotei archaeon]|nr:ABC transporter ATP-binding protein [Thermoprotei archaeon]
MDKVVVVNDVVKVYTVGDRGVTALRGVSLEVYRGELAIIMGPSGSGKTTLLNIMAGLDRPSSGKIYVLGNDLNIMDDEELNRLRLHKIGIVFQFLNLISRLTAKENIELPMLVSGRSKDYINSRVDYLASKLGIEDVLDKMVEDLSGGEQQRVAIAAALANDPEILLADEPTAELDSDNIRRVISIFRESVDSGKTVIVNTHDPRVAREGDRVFLLEDGALKGVYRPRELTSDLESSKSISEYIGRRLEELRDELERLTMDFRNGVIGAEEFIKRYNRIKTLEEVFRDEFRVRG